LKVGGGFAALLLALACSDPNGVTPVVKNGDSGVGDDAEPDDGAAIGGAAEEPARAPKAAGFDFFSPQGLLAGEGGGAGEGSTVLAPPYGISSECGDAIVGADEECDDGTGGAGDACTDDCQTRDQPARPVVGEALPSNDRYLGAGRHPVAGGEAGFITTYVETGGEEPVIGATLFDIWGQRQHFVSVSEGASPIDDANPVAVALPDGSYAVAWGDFDGDGSDLGVALRRVAADGTLGSLRHASSATQFSQLNPDVIWTGSELVVAWEDYADPFNGPDLRVRTFDAKLNPTSGDVALAVSNLPEAAVSLAPFNGGWAAAYREGAVDGAETIVVKVGADSHRVGPIQGGPIDDRPALVELDEGHLLVVFSAGSDPGATGLNNVSRLFYAIVETAEPAVPAFFALDPLDRIFSAESRTAQVSPALERTEHGVYLAWRSEARPGDAAGDQVWLKRLRWQASDPSTIDAEQVELLIPRTCDASHGDQRRPALSRTSLPPSGGLAIAWDDYGRNDPQGSGEPDVQVHYAPLHAGSESVPPRLVRDSWPGVTGAPWPAHWSSSSTGPVQLTTQFAEGEFHSVVSPGSALAWVNDHAAVNVDVSTTIRLNIDYQYGGLFARRADEDPDSYLWVSINAAKYIPWRLNATIDGVTTELATYPGPLSFWDIGVGTQVDWRLRFRAMTNADGTLFTAMKIWRIGAVEPAAWLMSSLTPASSPVAQRLGNVPGRFGVLAQIVTANGGRIYFDDFRASFFEGTGTGDLDQPEDVPLLLPRANATYRRCSPTAPCEQADGCCSGEADCAAGLTCSARHAVELGVGSHAAVCTVDHCANSIHDVALEARADCGGPDCPACTCTSTVTKGSAGYCSPPCICGIGDYPCTKNAGCLPGLLCGADNAEPFGGAFGVDACVPPHCMNRVLDADLGETAADCGGDCGSNCNVCSPTNGATGHCRVYCPCPLGQGHCRQDDECVAGLVCAQSRGTRFGLTAANHVCIPEHCRNNVKDTALGETGVDCGNACGCQGPCAGHPCPP
jgi:hypothetical protein